ncbi:structural protein [Spongiibacter sp.]|uniref:structural protein n=1 Tax=Spongiibacter sp. TaxID=2024860 RepID=UPI00257B5FB7|nr:structural protein [Spongiibacter sp.]
MQNLLLLTVAVGVLMTLPGNINPAAPRGIRNNNPLNIREGAGGGDQWRGEYATELDDAFEEFNSPEWGYRAAKRIVQSYRRRGITTLRGIVSAWAPTNENNTGAYVNSVASKTGLPPEHTITDADLPALFRAMAIHENGAAWALHPSLSLATINRGLALA